MTFDDIEKIRKAASEAIYPIRPVDEETMADGNFLFNAKRTNAGRQLPPYYLVYFLLVDLLIFRDLGQFEKIAWSVPIDFKGKAFLIEHRKFGVGVFAQDLTEDEPNAEIIVSLVRKGVKAAEPYFDYLAEKAVNGSKLNVRNNSNKLYERYEYFMGEYKLMANEAKARSEEKVNDKVDVTTGITTSDHFPAFELRRKSRWLALATIDAFFSWTEHVFIHISILTGKISTGMEVAELAESDWYTKYKHAIGIDDPPAKTFYDKLALIKRQLRNFIAHGAFGKRGEAFSFHSGAGAVPVLLPHKGGTNRFTLTDDLAFDDSFAMDVIEEFIRFIWTGNRGPAKVYIEDNSFPTILPWAADGTYQKAMLSNDSMEELSEYLSYQIDQSANMDW